MLKAKKCFVIKKKYCNIANDNTLQNLIKKRLSKKTLLNH